jgi:hypothetical protein
MFTTGAKYFFGVAIFSLIAAFVWGFVTYGNGVGMSTFTGVISLGFKGGVGEHVGYTLFVALAGASLFLGATSSALRDADPQAVAEVAAAAEAPVVRAPQGNSVWPAVAAFGAGLVILGLVFSSGLVILGLIFAALAAVELTVRAWSERATGDARVNRQVRNRVMYPLEIPLLAIVGVVFFVGALSRLLLAVDEHIAAIIFGAVPLVALIVAGIVSARPRILKSVTALLLTLGALGILATGVIGLARGERHFENKANVGQHYTPKLAPGPLGQPNTGLKVPEGNG